MTGTLGGTFKRTALASLSNAGVVSLVRGLGYQFISRTLVG